MAVTSLAWLKEVRHTIGFKFEITRRGHFCIFVAVFIELKGAAELLFKLIPKLVCVYVFWACTGSAHKSVQWSSEGRLREVY